MLRIKLISEVLTQHLFSQALATEKKTQVTELAKRKQSSALIPRLMLNGLISPLLIIIKIHHGIMLGEEDSLVMPVLELCIRSGPATLKSKWSFPDEGRWGLTWLLFAAVLRGMRINELCSRKGKSKAELQSSSAVRTMRPFAMQWCFTPDYALPQLCLETLVSHSDELFDILIVGMSPGHATWLNICVLGEVPSLSCFDTSEVVLVRSRCCNWCTCL